MKRKSKPNKYTIEQINNKKPVDSKLIALYYAERKGIGNRSWVMCKCNCGIEKEILLSRLLNGITKSCGCYKNGNKRKGIGFKYTTVNRHLRAVYAGMMARCYNITSFSYKNYGAKGIIVCEEWKNNYQVFLDWALNNGWVKGLQLDKDMKYKEKHGTDTGMIYSPEYCSFITLRENMNHRTNNLYVAYKNERMSLADACRLGNLDYTHINGRMLKGWTFAEAMTIPKYCRRNSI